MMGRHETMCPRTNLLGPLVTIMNRPRNTMSLHCYIPVIFITFMYCIMHIMTGMYQSRDIVFLGRLILGTRGPRTFAPGHIVLGRPVTPPTSLSNR